ncbi:polysaccharide biosynthesis protein [Vibrio sinaloensis]|uniref:Nucleoside-diphosphate sugar epimerase n=1 Tax=Photobacterium sp. (strain ATCC 43367) TaxID=379097 RepID=A0A0A5JHM0_PHOS4|nr:nucleoside-diphosphate sugar epimerase/dehydratase [Vibrio sinaloensis]KGY07448.1 nucleoside-diphosphate sugar epimerase [Vibrio sinaloensis]
MRFLFTLSRPAKRVVGVLSDVLAITAAFWGAYYTRMGDISEYVADPEYWFLLAALIVATLGIIIRSGLYRAILRYMSTSAIVSISATAAASGLLVVLLAHYFQLFLPRSVPFIYASYFVIFAGGARLLMKHYINSALSSGSEPVIIYGAGSAGRQLVNLIRQGKEYKVVAFIDDDKSLKKTTIHGITVFRRSKLKFLVEKYSVSKVLLAIPSASRGQRRDIIERLTELQVEVLTVPNLDDIINGSFQLDQLKEVTVEDLLGRDTVEPNQELLEKNITGKVVMVTGAGGSIGSELCRQIIGNRPQALVLFELSEFGLYQIDREISQLVNDLGLEITVFPILGSVQNSERLKSVMSSFKVQTVYHAAAYKHVPLVEYNVIEGVENNIFGTFRTAQAAVASKVESFVLISTDKAVRPTNVMGTTKRIAELGLQALAEQENAKENGTRFCMVRFGNVLGSSGSVIPVFKKQIEAGGPVTVTHPDIIRYFMTIPEAAQLVIQAGAMGKGGDVFVLDMGEPVRIADLAKNLIHLSGLEIKDKDNDQGDIEIVYSGLRPGEKLFEELLIGDKVLKTSHERIMAANEVHLSYEEYCRLIDRLAQACSNFAHDDIRNILLEAPAGFNPTDGVADLVWARKVNNCNAR